MTPEDFTHWLAAMKAAGLGRTIGGCAKHLDVSPDTMTRLRQCGTDRRTALACAAILQGVEPYSKGDGE